MASILKLKRQQPDESKLTEINAHCDIHIWVEQTRGRKCATFIRGLNMDKKQMKNLAKKFRKEFSTGGSVIIDETAKGDTDSYQIFINGRNGKNVKKYLNEKENINEENITLHGD